jgi:hypothetical protein
MPADAQRVLECAGARLQGLSGEHVVEHAHALEQRDVLEGARDALARGGARVGRRQRHAVDAHRAALGAIDAADHVQERALASTVGTDDRADLPLRDREAHVGERLDAGERERDVVDGETWRCRELGHAAVLSGETVRARQAARRAAFASSSRTSGKTRRPKWAMSSW